MLQFFVLLAVVIYAIVHFIGWYYTPKDDSPALKLEQANQRIGELQSDVAKNYGMFQEYYIHCNKLMQEIEKQKQDFEKLQHQKISADVRIGQKTENILPFLAEFPYKDEEIRGLFNPIDLIVFAENEVIFVEVKTGASQLSDKQRRIRDNIKAGRVRFEVHRLNEKGITVK